MNEQRLIVYVVDDDPSVRRGLGRLFRSAHMEVHTFASADEFFESGCGGETGCLVVDAKMPRVGGTAMLKRLQENHSPLPVIVISAHDDPATREEAMAAGAVGYFRKPVDAEALLDAIRWALRRPGNG
jgi:FixJ family two-component response regulator